MTTCSTPITATLKDCPDRLVRKIATFLSAKDAWSLSLTCHPNLKTLSLSALLVCSEALHVPQERRQNATPATKKKLTRIHVPLLHRTQSVFVRVVYNYETTTTTTTEQQQQPTTPAEPLRVFLLSHNVNEACMTFDKGCKLYETSPGTTLCFCPTPHSVYTLWVTCSNRTTTPPCLSLKTYNVIFDVPGGTRLVLSVYDKLYAKMGALHKGGLLYLRLLQSLANTLLFQLRFQQTPETGLVQILKDLKIALAIPDIQVLGEIVTWVEEDVCKFEEFLEDSKPDDPMEERRRQRRMFLRNQLRDFRDRRDLMEADNNQNQHPQNQNNAAALGGGGGEADMILR